MNEGGTFDVTRETGTTGAGEMTAERTVETQPPERIRSCVTVDARVITLDRACADIQSGDRRVHSYIALDTETTGLNPKQDRIIEIGAARVLDGMETECFQTLVNPRRLLDLRVSELTGITDGMLADAPDMDEVLDRFLEFAGDLPVLGHNILFDFSFLKRAAVNRQREFERQGVDTLALCRHFMPKDVRKSLNAACAFCGIRREGSHRALGDARDAHRLYQRLLALYGESEPEAFAGRNLIYKVKREQPASEKQKEGLRDLLKYHKIELPLQIDSLSRSEISRIRDKIISQYGRIGSTGRGEDNDEQ